MMFYFPLDPPLFYVGYLFLYLVVFTSFVMGVYGNQIIQQEDLKKNLPDDEAMVLGLVLFSCILSSWREEVAWFEALAFVIFGMPCAKGSFELIKRYW